MNAVVGGDVEAGGRLGAIGKPIRVGARPCCATIGRAHSSAGISSVTDIRIRGSDPKVKRVPTPPWSEALTDPRVVDIGRTAPGLLPNYLPATPATGGFARTE